MTQSIFSWTLKRKAGSLDLDSDWRVVDSDLVSDLEVTPACPFSSLPSDCRLPSMQQDVDICHLM